MLANNLSVGVLAEDAAESCHKLYRHNRQFHARKKNRTHNLSDVFNRALVWSDPIVASFDEKKPLNRKNRKSLPIAVINLLKVPHDNKENADEDEEENEISFDYEISENLNNMNLPEDLYYSVLC